MTALVEPAAPTWEDLAAAAVAGEQVARRDLVRLCLARVRRQAVLMGARGADLEAVVRRALEEAFGALATFRAECPFVTWLDRIDARVLLASAGKWRPRPAGAARPAAPEGRAVVEDATGYLAALEPERRLAVILAGAGGLGVEEVAEVMGGAPDAARARIDRARRELSRAGVDAVGALEAVMTRGDDALLDSLTERRLERAAIAALDRAPSSAPVPAARPRRWAWAGLGAVAAAAAGLLAAAVLWPPGPPTPPPRLDAIVALAAGGATVGGAPARAGRWVGGGASFMVPAGGRLALALGDGSLLTLAGDTRGMVEAWTVSDARIRLEAGTLVARIGRRREGPFVVHASGLEVQAASAVVAVTAAEAASARVLRGSARVRLGGAAEQAVPARRELSAGTQGAHAIDRARWALDWELAGRGAIDARGAKVQLETTPPGATVSFDGEAVGRTPVSVLVRPGTAGVSIELADHAPVREQILLAAGQAETRRFTLFPLRARVRPEGSRAGPTAPAGSAR